MREQHVHLVFSELLVRRADHLIELNHIQGLVLIEVTRIENFRWGQLSRSDGEIQLVQDVVKVHFLETYEHLLVTD